MKQATPPPQTPAPLNAWTKQEVVSLEYRHNIEKRIDMDMLKRSIPGVLIYAILWPVIFISWHLDDKAPVLSWGFAAGLLGLSLLRLLQWKFTRNFYLHSPQLWLGAFAFLSLAQALLWGLLFALSLFYPPMQPVTLIMAFSIAAMTSGALAALNPRLWVAISNICLLVVPGLAVSVFWQNNYSQAVLILIYLSYMTLLGRRSHHEYIRAFDIEAELEVKGLELKRLAQIDPLTQISNRGHFNTALQMQWRAGARNHREQSLLLIDIDHFKSINDKYGHLVGDQCLISLAQILSNSAKRKTDWIARYGGEEFVILLSDTAMADALDLAESIRRSVEEYTLYLEDTEVHMTISIGVACLLPDNLQEPTLLVSQADQALYLAKESGRNRVCMYA